MREGLRAICDEDGTALLVTSHDMAEVERLCDRVVFISDGRIVADGTPAEVAERFGRSNLEGVFLHLADDHRPPTVRPSRRSTSHERRRTAGAGAGAMPPPVRLHGVALTWLRMRAVARRHAYVLARSPHRLFDVTLWPLVDVLLFGALATYVGGGHATGGGRAAGYLHRRASCCGTSCTSRRSR